MSDGIDPRGSETSRPAPTHGGVGSPSTAVDVPAGTMPFASGPLDPSAVFRDHAPYVWRALRRLGVPEADVEDVCQEVFLVVLRRHGDFEGRSSLRTWIYGIALRVASDYRRSARVRREVLTDEVPEERQSAPQHDVVALRESARALDGLLDALDDGKREVFVLYEIEQLTLAQVADAVGCPLQTAYSRLLSARKIVEEGALRWRSR